MTKKEVTVKHLKERLEKESGKKVVLKEEDSKEDAIKQLTDKGGFTLTRNDSLPKAFNLIFPPDVYKKIDERWDKTTYDWGANILNSFERFLIKILNKYGISAENGGFGDDDTIDITINNKISTKNKKEAKELVKIYQKEEIDKLLPEYNKIIKFLEVNNIDCKLEKRRDTLFTVSPYNLFYFKYPEYKEYYELNGNYKSEKISLVIDLPAPNGVINYNKIRKFLLKSGFENHHLHDYKKGNFEVVCSIYDKAYEYARKHGIEVDE